MVVYEGFRPPIPESTPAGYAELMQQCWHSDPLARWGHRPAAERCEGEVVLAADLIGPQLVWTVRDALALTSSSTLSTGQVYSAGHHS